jgi:hypothetical protein
VMCGMLEDFEHGSVLVQVLFRNEFIIVVE